MSINKLKRVSENLLKVTSCLYKHVNYFESQLRPNLNSHFYKKFLNLCVNSKYRNGSTQCNKAFITNENKFEMPNMNKYSKPIHFVAIAGIFSFFQTKEDEEESELIMTIKRAVLMIQVRKAKTLLNKMKVLSYYKFLVAVYLLWFA